MPLIIRHRDQYEKQSQFIKHKLRREWKQILRFRIDKTNAHKTIQWCKENITGKWSYADGGDYYYFEETADAVYFRLRWTGQLAENIEDTYND